MTILWRIYRVKKDWYFLKLHY